jgi:hypothetical protein
MSKRIIKLSESDIKKHIQNVISEQPTNIQRDASRQRGQGQTPPPQNQTPPPQKGPKLPIDPKLNVVQNIQKLERVMGRQLTPIEINKLTFDLDNLKRSRKRTTKPTVDMNDLSGIDKGEGVNLYSDEAQKEVRYSATIDKIVKSGSGFDVFVSGDYTFRDNYYHWEPNAPYFQAFVKSTHKPLTWSYSGKTYTEKLYNKEFSSVLQQKVPTPRPNNGIDFVSGNVNEQNAVDFAPVAGPTNYGTAVDKMNIIKEKIVGQPVRFFMDKELKTPAYNGANFTFSKVEKDKSHSTRFKIYFKEFNDPLSFECGTFKDAFFRPRPSKGEFLYNATLYKYLTTALCNTTLSDDGKLKSVPNVKYVKNDTQGAPNQTNNQTLAENKKTNNMKIRKVVRLTESELKTYIQKIISEQSTPSPYKVGQVIKAKRDVDGQTYTIKVVKLLPDGYELVAMIDGRGNYEGHPLKGGPYSLNITQPGVLVGNTKMGTFTPIDSMNEQIYPDYSKGTHDIDKRTETYLPIAQKLAKQLLGMKFKFNGKNIFTNTFDGYHVRVEFSNQGVNISKSLEKNTGMPNMQAPLIIPLEKLNEMDFMKQVVDYVHGTKS